MVRVCSKLDSFLKCRALITLLLSFHFVLQHLYAVTKARVVFLNGACCLGLFTSLPLRIGHTTSFEPEVCVESEFNAVGRCSYFQEENGISLFFKAAGLSDIHVEVKESYFVTSDYNSL